MRSARPASFSIFCSAACTAPSIGTLVNSVSASKDTMISWSWISSLAMVEAKSVEFFTVKFELPARGDNTLAIIGRPYRLTKTSSKQSKRRDLHLK